MANVLTASRVGGKLKQNRDRHNFGHHCGVAQNPAGFSRKLPMLDP